jgi:hypothetical protein
MSVEKYLVLDGQDIRFLDTFESGDSGSVRVLSGIEVKLI